MRNDMRIIIDAMGGDHAPEEIIKGTAQAVKACDAAFVLVGDQDRIIRLAAENGISSDRYTVVHASNVISMDDKPLAAIQHKKDSSMAVGLRLLANGEGDAFVSAGNTGALFSGATLIVKRIAAVHRAAIGTVLPGTKPCLLLDAGANVSVTEAYLEQFAVMGSAYMKKMYGIAHPTVGLLNNGTEEGKGTPLQIEANKRLGANGAIHYTGNVEASAALFGACDVLVCDGFTGNVFLKAIEGMGMRILRALKETYTKSMLTKLSFLPVKRPFAQMKKEFDPAEHGGSPLLGISKPVIKAHGSSNAKAFKNAVFQAISTLEGNVCGQIADEISALAVNMEE